MELNNQADAIILSKISDRKNIIEIKSTDIYLGCLVALGLVVKQISSSKSPVGYLSPFYMKMTLLTRKANTSISAIMSSESYKKSLPYSDPKLAAMCLSKSISDLAFCALEFEEIGKSKDKLTSELKVHLRAVQIDAVSATYSALKNLELILGKNQSNISDLQSTTIKHLDQLIKLI